MNTNTHMHAWMHTNNAETTWEQEARITESLHEARKGKTTIIIAHRLCSVVHADEIVVMEKASLLLPAPFLT